MQPHVRFDIAAARYVFSKKEATSGAAGAFERKDMCHPFPSKPDRAFARNYETMDCVGNVSLEFVLPKSDSDL